MKNRIEFTQDNLILCYSKNGEWEDKTNSLNQIYKAYSHGKFTGYDVYYKGTRGKYFYPLVNLKILTKLNDVNIDKKDVFVDGKQKYALKVEEFQQGYYKVFAKNENLLTNNLKLKSNKYKDTFIYFSELVKFVESNIKDEAISYLSSVYGRTEANYQSVLFEYFQGEYTIKNDQNVIIVPFQFNQSQYIAIEKALSNSISVIEGPPGTGKTQVILNLVANIILRGENCAVVSNNNTAIDNISEKFFEENLSFYLASLGNRENSQRFFENNKNETISTFLANKKPKVFINTSKLIQDLSLRMKHIHELELDSAILKTSINELLSERRNFVSTTKTVIEINQNLLPNEYLQLVQRIEEGRKIKFLERWFIYFKYKVKLKVVVINDLLITCEKLFYQKKITEIENRIKKYDQVLSKYNKTDIEKEVKANSMDLLLNKLHDHYSKLEIKEFTFENYKSDFTNFLKQYPVILSTTHSVSNNIPKGFLFDYLIIDEASQGDLLSSVIALNCAKKVVVVGDSRQLQQIDDERLYDESKLLARKYDILESFQYESNSILKSVRNAVKKVPITLLKEHYRCAPDIIGFCNKMFYDNELIAMTKNTGKHIEIIKTVPGNHARKNLKGAGLYNQREIDELKNILIDKDMSKIGIITPFRCQAELIQEEYGGSSLEADTIHKFQGRQKDEIVLSFVVNSLDKDPNLVENRLYDFVTDEKLLNVAISRSKNKVTAIVSDKLYESKNNIIKDFIKYSEYLYGDNITKESTVVSIFDYLYKEQSRELIKKFKENENKFDSELLMSALLEKVLKPYTMISYTMHTRLSKIVKKVENFSDEEREYLLHPWTHVDFLIYNNVSKEPLFVVEVDGIKYHEQSVKQTNNDEIKDRALLANNIAVHRFKTNQSNEEHRLIEIIKNFVY